MNWLHDASYLFAGAKPPGQGLSSSTTNVVWGFFNFVIGYVLTCKVGNFDLHTTDNVVAFGTGGLLIGILSARLFGRFHRGNYSGKP
jgi:hypothetical protein